jgi:H+-transporting ATPase
LVYATGAKTYFGKTFKVTKGAPQVILALSANAGQVKPAVEKAVNEFAARGFRSLGVARAEGEGPWQFLGVLPLFDLPTGLRVRQHSRPRLTS